MKKNRKSLWKKSVFLLSAALLAGVVAGNGSDLGKGYAAGSTPLPRRMSLRKSSVLTE